MAESFSTCHTVLCQWQDISAYVFMISLQCFDTVGWAFSLWKVGCWFVGGDDL